jgi:RimJ/RimL family protein N-acetyltransferase
VQPRPPDTIDLGPLDPVPADGMCQAHTVGRLVLRRWAAGDVPALTVAVVESLDHLRPWMVWAAPELATEAAFVRFVRDVTARAADGGEAVYGVFDATTGAVLGGVGLHDRGTPGSVEIGYWLHVAATGQGLMTRIVAALTDMALAMDDVAWVEIRCDQANAASAAVPRRLGYEVAAVVVSDRPQAPADTGRDVIWVRTTPIGAPPR